MASELASVVEDAIKNHGTRLSDTELASRKAEEAGSRRYEAAAWLRRTVGVVGARDLPEQPSEEEFRVGVRNGMILCTTINRVIPGVVPKVVEIPADSNVLPDGAAISAYQHFENVRNFLVVMQDIGLPTFEASDLEQGGNGSKVVNSVLALKTYNERKNGCVNYEGISKPVTPGKHFMRKNSEPFKNSLSKNQSAFSVERSVSADFSIQSAEMTTTTPLNVLVGAVLSDKKPEEVPVLVELMLSKVMQEFERRLATQKEQVSTTLKDVTGYTRSFSDPNVSTGPSAFYPVKMGMKDDTTISRKEDTSNMKEISTISMKECSGVSEADDYFKISRKNASNSIPKQERNLTIARKVDSSVISKNEELLRERVLRQRLIFDEQQRQIQELKHTLHATSADMELLKTSYYDDIDVLEKHFKVLARAASDYHKVLGENRKLYNQVQDLKGNIRVYCRVRPFLPGQANGMTTVGRIDDGNITIISPSRNGKEARKSFTFNKAFGPSATQGEVFADTQPLIRSVLDGYNICIFAYGQTGSGKTFTMTGPKELSKETLGVNYRALNDLFLLSEQRRDTFSYEISVQMMEVYNEQVRDLLVTDGLNKKLEIRNSPQNGLSVPDANLVHVTSTSDVMQLMKLGHKNRVVGSTAINDRSSRSHSCLTVHVQGRDLTSGNTIRGCMHLVDLAGSERVDKSEVKGDRLKEAVHINRSLSALGDVIAALAQKNTHVPYRNSKLTQLLQDSLGGQAKTLMFVHISPEADAIGETISTLKFAERVATVELGAARSNKETPEVKELKEQIAILKATLARKGDEHEHNQSMMSSPHILRTNSCGSASSLRHEDATGFLINNRHPLEDVRNIEVRNDSLARQKKANYDFQELLTATDSPPWLDNFQRPNFEKGDEKECGNEEWIDKVPIRRDDDSAGDWDRESTSALHFYQKYLPDMRVHSEQYHRNTQESLTDDSDLEIATSESSEPDMLWQFNTPKIIHSVGGGATTKKQPQSKAVKSPDTRVTSSHTPSPSPNVSNGSRRSQNRTGGLVGRHSTTSKMGSRK